MFVGKKQTTVEYRNHSINHFQSHEFYKSISFTYEIYYLVFKLGIKYVCDDYKSKAIYTGVTEEDIEQWLYIHFHGIEIAHTFSAFEILFV